MQRVKNSNTNNNDQTKTTTETMAVTSSSRNHEPRTANRANISHSVIDVGRRNISETRKVLSQVSYFPWLMEDSTRCQHFLYFYEPPTFPIPSHCLTSSLRDQLSPLSCVPYPFTIPIYPFNFSNVRISPYHSLPYHATPLFQIQPEGAEASSLSCWPDSQRCLFMECNGERGHHSRTLEPRAVQSSVQHTRLREGVSRTGYGFNDCYALPSTMLHFAPTCNPDSRYHHPPIFHIPLKPETPKDRQQSLKYQNFPSPPHVRYNLTPPDSLFVPEKNPLGNLFNMLQADLAPKRPRYLLKDIKYGPNTSSISSIHHLEDHPECISLGYLYHISPHKK